MCIGIPMQVEICNEFDALCRDGDNTVRVDTSLVAGIEPGDWLLVFLGAAREVLDPATAQSMRQAVEAVSLVMSGESKIDHLFQDLIDQPPQLPAHLQPGSGE